MQKRRKTEVISKQKTQSVYERIVSGFIAASVLLVQVLLPLAPVFANEGEAVVQESAPIEAPAVESVPEPEEETSETSPEPEIEASSEPTNIESIESEEISTDIPSEQTADVPTETAGDTPADEALPEDETLLVRDETQSPETEGEVSTNPEVTPEEILIPEEVPGEDIGTTTEEIIEPEIVPEEIVVPEGDEELVVEEETDEEEETSTTTEQTVVVPEVHTVTNDENRLSFGVDDCARVADGSFYCKSIEEETTVADSERVFAGPDIDGDSEIYIEHNGELTQLSFNIVDDSAPYYDEQSETIVWHRLVDARYQIVSYDLESGEEVVLTNDHYNNMQPTRAGDLIVWQGWVGNDWEILLMEDGEITMLTDNTVHDIGPRINGDYVLWQAEEAGGWKVKVYNRLTKETESIADADGASIENPRFVLLYDAKQENGDVETRGYDLESGENVPLRSVPHNLPDEIPDPEQTGEDRALIVNTTQLKTKTEDDTEPDIDPTETVPTPAGDTGVGTTTEDIVIPPFIQDGELEVPVVEPTDSIASSSDLIIEPIIEEIQEPPVEDLVVPPYTPPTVEGDDPQDTVATST